ncbi:MAG: rRNA maturation RNase YbeY [Candidatus Omnitrophica bacterium]|jgi:probable rRNA maturation factor|nr:rRNA maturation RNase YbeY [Candidatus Omnitrophota bacterium]MDD4981998.1 rRNA maturation RNase YbeY [Candidatus Omnitrophota bacterium]MDD5665356.1 rRNA maturation RNase YbeY [Candidatus Omnitrophota bacterium]
MLRISIRNLQQKVSVSPEAIKKTFKQILKKEKVGAGGEIVVSFVTDPLIRKLNARYLKEDSFTDVLAFETATPFDKKGFYADIIISVDTARRNSRVYKTTPSYELKLYAVHGLLHLLGYNHNLTKKNQLMRRKEEEYVHT